MAGGPGWGRRTGKPRLLLWALLVVFLLSWPGAHGLGVNWGRRATRPLPPEAVVRMLQDNGISKVKLFDADADAMSALAGSGVEVMVAVPNEQLQAVGSDHESAKQWVESNVTRHLLNGVDIKYVAVGNEPFLSSYNGSFLNATFPALQNIQKALDEAGVGDSVKATVPFNIHVYNSPDYNPVPSAGRFRSDISDLMTHIVQFLSKNSAPLVVDIHPFMSVYANKGFPVSFAFFEGGSPAVCDNGIQYTNIFDAVFDTLISALKTIGFGDMPIMVGEIGWPTDGDINANAAYAETFYGGLLKRLTANQGTPLRPNTHIEVYLLSLIDEDAGSLDRGNFEHHWGIFTYDGQPKFPLDLSGQGQDKLLVGARECGLLSEAWLLDLPKAFGWAMDQMKLLIYKNIIRVVSG